MNDVNRRHFLKTSVAAAALGLSANHPAKANAADEPSLQLVDDFARPDSLYHGDAWESLNPGYWKIENGALRRRLKNVGDRARKTGFPFHYETHQQQAMPVEYDPSLPFGMIWHRGVKLAGNYAARITATIRALRSEPGADDKPEWMQFQPGYSLFGICFGGKTLFESWNGAGNKGDAAWMAVVRDDGRFGIYDHATDAPDPVQPDSETKAFSLAIGQQVTIAVEVTGDDEKVATVTARIAGDAGSASVNCANVEREKFLNGNLGVVARGLFDFEINRVEVLADCYADPPAVSDLHVAYPLGDTLHEVDGAWRCKFIGLFRNEGERAEIRVSDSETPTGGWENISAAGSAAIVSNDFRRNTAVIDVALPASPAEKPLYYTVWKDGVNVTGDPRSGFLGKKDYVGRLPQLRAPYRLCGLSCHAITGPSDLPGVGMFQENWVHDQPTPDACRYLDDYSFQVMLWEDDVWYLELVLYTPSTDDAYKIITTTIAGPTTRWQMMRHWNVLNPGDHDHGMDDVKGPEQIAVRTHADLGQDPEYMRRNFQIVSHLMTGDENPSGAGNPRRWRRWKMPNRDFSLLILDSRLWRSSQDTKIWDSEGWGHKRNLYDRTDPTRSLLGEEQFAWLQQMIRTDSSPLICLTGINGLHTIWTGFFPDPDTKQMFYQRDRVAADFAGWVSAGADRVIELLGSRTGVVSVYGDVHNGSMIRNIAHGVIECSFGPIGRYGGRDVKENFGPKTTDYDGRELDVIALYTKDFDTPQLRKLEGPKYWNFLEMEFDPAKPDGEVTLQLRNIVDPPTAEPRGGGTIATSASKTARPAGSWLSPSTLLPNADVHLTLEDGTPLRGARTQSDGSLSLRLPDVAPGTQIIVTSFDGEKAESSVMRTREA